MRSSLAGGLAVIVVGLCVACINRAALRQHVVQRVSEIIAEDQASLRDDLQTTVNPRGQGLVVYLRQGAVGCGPSHSWIFLSNQRIFAVDDASRHVTPTAPLIEEATVTERQDMGLTGIDPNEMVRAQVCSEAG
jgi:hypothetical protein